MQPVRTALAGLRSGPAMDAKLADVAPPLQAELRPVLAPQVVLLARARQEPVRLAVLAPEFRCCCRHIRPPGPC
jgi:hypothetical protein